MKPTWLAPILARLNGVASAYKSGWERGQDAESAFYGHSPSDVARMAEALKIACLLLGQLSDPEEYGECWDTQGDATLALKRIEALGREE